MEQEFVCLNQVRYTEESLEMICRTGWASYTLGKMNSLNAVLKMDKFRTEE